MNAVDGAIGGMTRSPLERLEATFPTISAVRDIFHAPSFSVGVLHQGEVVLTKGFGVCSTDSARVPDQDTIYSIGSCTKAFTSTAIGLLEQHQKVNWSEPVSKHLPGFRTRYSPVVGREGLFSDILSHSTGLASLPHAVLGRHGATFTSHKDVVHICSNLPRATKFRTKWQYNNWMYALAACLVEQQAGSSWGEFVQKNIFDELKLERTFTNYPPDDNYARSYIVFSDGSSIPSPLPDLNDNMAFDGSGSIRSCVRDMLEWTKAVIKAAHFQPTEGNDSHATDGNSDLQPNNLPINSTNKPNLEVNGGLGCDTMLPPILKILKALHSAEQPHFPLQSDSQQAYGLGFFTFNLPTEEINNVTNIGMITTPYKLGADSPPRKVIGHTGDLQNFVTAYWTFPESDSAVIVMSNTGSPHGDPTNIVAQVLMQALFQMKPEIDYEVVAREIFANSQIRWEKTVEAWTLHRVLGTEPIDLKAYTGKFVNSELSMTLDVYVHQESRLVKGQATQLQLRINSLEAQTFDLYHYHNDCWTFLPGSKDEGLAEGFLYYLGYWTSFIVEFTGRVGESFQGVSWDLSSDDRVGPQTFGRVCKRQGLTSSP